MSYLQIPHKSLVIKYVLCKTKRLCKPKKKIKSTSNNEQRNKAMTEAEFFLFTPIKY